ncbi:hypothetical protein HMPREF9104_02008 [Lentilactobacillus kisonensis F0435]|uniref:Uncharacterized protein n=1 Tax=Lentilactobacillus kisonensis F0435 TaxID=797516 RepID=H1LHB8_9LACO|nr:hypothetical protein HMPREF9104_02008 [Lentilactobacillus kisonensis F0435]
MQSRNFHISTPDKNPQNQEFMSEETYVPVSKRLAPAHLFRTATQSRNLRISTATKNPKPRDFR